jgi:Amiloride-sensitive sodium channel
VEPSQAKLDTTSDAPVTHVTIYFGELKYTEVEQYQLMNPSSFVANLGGVFGLCTGMSVVTIIQALALSVEYMLNKFRKPSNWSDMKKAVQCSGYIGRLDWHGLLDLYLAKTRGWRVFWVIIILSCCSTFTFFCHGEYKEFIYNNTVTGLSITPAKSAPFPFIRVCHKEGRHNLTYIHQTLKSLNLSDDEGTSALLYYIISQFSNPTEPSFAPSNVIQGIQMYMKLFGPQSIHKLDIVDFLVNSSFSCQQTFASCTLNSEPFDCCSKVHSYYTILGFCHQLDHLNGATQEVLGSGGGISFHVKLHKEEFLRASNILYGSKTRDNTLAVYFSESERLNLFDESVLLTPGTRNRVRLETEEFKFIPGLEKKCVEVPPMLSFSENQYLEELCYTECAYNMALQICRCQLPMYYAGKNISWGVYCTPLDLITCVSKLIFMNDLEDSKLVEVRAIVLY